MQLAGIGRLDCKKRVDYVLGVYEASMGHLILEPGRICKELGGVAKTWRRRYIVRFEISFLHG